MNLLRSFLIMSVLATVFVAAIPTVRPTDEGKEGIQFFTGSWKEALAKAKAEKKLIFLDAYASWCGPCKMMQARTFPVKRVGDFFNEKFVSVKIDMEKGEGPVLADVYPINAYPTLFFMDAKGKVLRQVVGAQSPDSLLDEARRVAR